MIIYSINNVVHTLKMGSDGLFGFLEGGPGVVMRVLDKVGDEGGSVFDEGGEVGEAFPADGGEVLLDNCISGLAHIIIMG